MSDEIVIFKTCKSCGNDNPKSASRCNGCGRSLEGFFGPYYHKRWVCPQDGRINMMDNSKCVCGYEKPNWFWDFFIFVVITSLIGFIIMVIYNLIVEFFSYISGLF